MEFDILYNDDDIVVCVKPQGIISQGDVNGKKNMVSLLQEELKSEIFPVHRLDKETGGVMVFAKNSKSASVLNKAIVDDNFSKEYLALVHNDIVSNTSTLTDLLYFDRQRNKSYVVKRERKGVKKAVLDYETLTKIQHNEKVYTLVKIILKTGRTHQIRVQFAARGNSLMGDRKYGADDNSDTLGLWAYKLSFKHPKTKENLIFKSLPNPTTFLRLDCEAFVDI